MNECAAATDSGLNADDVAKYLAAHPDFFANRDDLIAQLSIPHETGDAVSLVRRQVAVLRERNDDLRVRLERLLENARDNDKLFDKTKRLVLTLIEGQDMGDIVDALFYSFHNDFNIHFTTLLLFGDADHIPASEARVVPTADAFAKLGDLLRSNRAFCGQLPATALEFLFAGQAMQVGSVALVPLSAGQLYGVLVVANRDPQFYRSSMGTLFLSYIADVLNRLLPPFLKG